MNRTLDTLTLIIVRICCGIITIRSIDLLRARLLSSLSLPVPYGLSLPKDPFLDVPLQEVRDCCSPRVSLSCLAKTAVDRTMGRILRKSVLLRIRKRRI